MNIWDFKIYIFVFVFSGNYSQRGWRLYSWCVGPGSQRTVVVSMYLIQSVLNVECLKKKKKKNNALQDLGGFI